MPASCIPSIKLDVIETTSKALLAKDLSPIILEVFSSISKTGAKLISIPAAINSLEINQPISLKNLISLLALAYLDTSCIEGIFVNSLLKRCILPPS